jgi:hypothetical protein
MMESPISILILIILLAGWFLPVPPGIFGALLDYYIFGGKEEEQRKERLFELLQKLEDDGTDIHTEIKKARKGESKYITVCNVPRKKTIK